MTTPTPTPTSAVASAPATAGSSPSASSSGQSPVAMFALEILGVVILAVIAGIGPRVGKIVALFTLGLLILWLVLNASTLKRLIPGTNVGTQG
jgi:hypothetical protein